MPLKNFLIVGSETAWLKNIHGDEVSLTESGTDRFESR